jgi:hypothetical protein
MGEAAASSGLDQLIARLDNRAQRLRRQAHIFLTIIILVLISGAAAFVYANKIVALGQSHSAAAEYAAVDAAYKRLDQRTEEINTQVNKILDTTPLQGPFNDEIEHLKPAVYAAEDEVIRECKSVTYQQNRDDSNYVPNPQPARDRIGEYFVVFPMRDVYFGNSEDAVDCGQKLGKKIVSIGELVKPINVVRSDRDTRTNQFRASKSTEIEPYNKQLQELNEERSKLQPVLAETSKRAIEERVLGGPLESGDKIPALDKSGPTDWARSFNRTLPALHR